MTRLSVNINKIATLRNARGGNNPNVLQVALDCERFGAEGITVHPRPDERHIRYDDVRLLKTSIQTEFNIEGNPDERFIKLIEEIKPHQVTLVPDAPTAITSNSGWDTIKHRSFLSELIPHLKKYASRVSVFVDPDVHMVRGAADVSADRIELYTEPYASQYAINKSNAIAAYKLAAQEALKLQMGINAGHDLDLHNLRYLRQELPALHEVSIGHALICDALYYGLENTIQLYLKELK
ncbi:MAG TPA: pyridoxine 5'-phosphate synthase [Cytophagaceae bacterium]|jgi:pyridoxine 5-phosphate synthase|nr:pyridoxine 5'-phosphate synthase [Cytophagaceae bacterium]